MTEGVEFSASLTRPVLGSLVAKGSVSYTYTEAIFESSFFSNYIAWGIVQVGDQLPYIPEHSGVASVSLESEVWSLIGSVKFQETMREVAGSSPIEDDLHADGFVILDLTARYALSSNLELQVVAKNVTNEAPIASHRPFGARPEMPQTLIGRVIYEF